MHCRMFKKLAFCPSPHARTRPPFTRAPSFKQRRLIRPLSPRDFIGETADEARTKAVDFAKGSSMPEVIFTGPQAALRAVIIRQAEKRADRHGAASASAFHGTMNHQIIYQCYYAFAHRGFSVLRFNFRGVGRSQGSFDHGTGELSDAASALDGRRPLIRKRAPAGSRASRSAPGSACSF